MSDPSDDDRGNLPHILSFPHAVIGMTSPSGNPESDQNARRQAVSDEPEPCLERPSLEADAEDESSDIDADIADAIRFASEQVFALQQNLEHAQKARESFATRRAALTYHPPPELTLWETFDPICTDRQRQMSLHFQEMGISGLAFFITVMAKWELQNHQAVNQPNNAQPNASKTWRLISEDWDGNSGKLLMYYLSSLHPMLIQALIDGDLPSRMQDIAFRNRIGPSIEPKDRQGCYVVYIARGTDEVPSTQQAAQQTADIGKGFTINELELLHKTMTLYIDTADPASCDLALKIDGMFTGQDHKKSDLNYTYQRRYGGGQLFNQFHSHQGWLDYMRSCYTERMDKLRKAGEGARLDQPLERCFPYVGLSKSVLTRCVQHWNHSSSINILLGLVTATAEHLFPGQFGTHKFTWQIFKTVNRSHIGFDEKLLTILTSGYAWDGGLSTSYAGKHIGPGALDLSPEQDARLAANRNEITNSGLQLRNLKIGEMWLVKARKMIDDLRDRNGQLDDADLQGQRMVADCEDELHLAKERLEDVRKLGEMRDDSNMLQALIDEGDALEADTSADADKSD